MFIIVRNARRPPKLVRADVEPTNALPPSCHEVFSRESLLRLLPLSMKPNTSPSTSCHHLKQHSSDNWKPPTNVPNKKSGKPKCNRGQQSVAGLGATAGRRKTAKPRETRQSSWEAIMFRAWDFRVEPTPLRGSGFRIYGPCRVQ